MLLSDTIIVISRHIICVSIFAHWLTLFYISSIHLTEEPKKRQAYNVPALYRVLPGIEPERHTNAMNHSQLSLSSRQESIPGRSMQGGLLVNMCHLTHTAVRISLHHRLLYDTDFLQPLPRVRAGMAAMLQLWFIAL